jgi:hypothetical protein
MRYGGFIEGYVCWEGSEAHDTRRRVQNVERIMDTDKRKSNREAAEEYLGKVSDRYIFDAASGLYKPKTEQQRENKSTDTTGRFKRLPVWVSVKTDWLVTGVSIFTLILLCFTVYYTRRQWLEANRSANASETAAHAAESAAKTADQTLKEMRTGQGSQDTHMLAGQAVVQADAAKKATDNSEEFFRADERSWIELGVIKPVRWLATSKIFTIYHYEIYLRNAGKTQARNIAIRIPESSSGPWSTTEDKGAIEHLQKSFEKLSPVAAPIVLGAGETSPVPVVLQAATPIKTDTNPIPQYSFFVGRIDYEDVFNVPHWITFCFVVYNPEGELRSCKYGNEQDRNSETLRLRKER